MWMYRLIIDQLWHRYYSYGHDQAQRCWSMPAYCFITLALQTSSVLHQHDGVLDRTINKPAAKSWASRLWIFMLITCLSSPLVLAGPAEEHEKRNRDTIRVVMSAAFVSESGVGVYDDITRYLAKYLSRKVEFISGFSYSTINTMLGTGMADVGFICGLPYILKQDLPHPEVDLLLAPIMKDPKYEDKPIYFSYIIVHKDSPFKRLEDLRGHTFVYNDEISNSGYNMPRAELIRRGETDGFFGEIKRSGSHEESIRMIAVGTSDVSAVDSLVYDYDQINHPEFVDQTRIIQTLGPAGIPPVVVSSKMPQALRDQISDALLNMDEDALGKAILTKAMLGRFERVENSNYDSIRAMNKLAQDAGYMDIR